MFSIDPDAHSTSEIDHVRWGVSLARKGGLETGRILNCLGLKDFSEMLERRKAAVSGGKKPSRSLARASG
jgi:DNA polymerase (family 10)